MCAMLALARDHNIAPRRCEKGGAILQSKQDYHLFVALPFVRERPGGVHIYAHAQVAVRCTRCELLHES